MAVYIDDNLISTVDLYTPGWVMMNPVFSATFPYGQHTVKVAYTGTKNSSSTGTVVVLDKISYTGHATVVDDRALTYSGTWTYHDGQTGCYLDTTSAANASGAYGTYTFTGSAITLYAKTYKDRGKMTVYLDDNLMSIVDLYTSNMIGQNPVFSATFPYGQHTVKVAWTGTKNASSTGYVIVLDKLSYVVDSSMPSGDVVAVDDPDFTYTGTWQNQTDCTGAYNNTCSSANTSGAYGTYTFTGSAMTLYSRTAYNRGKMAVYLDDNLISIVDLYSLDWIDQNPVFWTTFPYGQHTVKVEWTGTQNPSSSGTAIHLDKMIYLADTPTATPTPTVTSTPTATVTPTFTPTPANSYTYNRVAAVNYADAWAHEPRNPIFPYSNYTGCECNNCTNFMSQVLLAGGYPPHGVPPNDNAEDWWYTSTDSSLTWIYIPSFKYYASIHPYEFEFRDSIINLGAGDLLVIDAHGATINDPPDNLPDHVKVVVGFGYTSTNQTDYTDGCGVDYTVPTSVQTVLIDQNCVDRKRVAWDYRLEGNHNRWYIRVLE